MSNSNKPTRMYTGGEHYETVRGKEREKAIAYQFAQWQGLTAVEFQQFYTLDFFFAYQNVCVAVAEIKTRDYTYGQYDNVMLSADKWKSGVTYANIFRIDFIYIVQFSDGIYYYQYDERDQFKLIPYDALQQNPDRDNVKEVQHMIMVKIPINKLNKIEYRINLKSRAY